MKNNKIETLKQAMIQLLHDWYALSYATNARVQAYIGNFNTYLRRQWTANGLRNANNRNLLYGYVKKNPAPEYRR